MPSVSLAVTFSSWSDMEIMVKKKMKAYGHILIWSSIWSLYSRFPERNMRKLRRKAPKAVHNTVDHFSVSRLLSNRIPPINAITLRGINCSLPIWILYAIYAAYARIRSTNSNKPVTMRLPLLVLCFKCFGDGFLFLVANADGCCWLDTKIRRCPV